MAWCVNRTYRDNLQACIVTPDSNSNPARGVLPKATGLSEDMLSHVLAGRKDLSIGTLTKALDRIGYAIKFVRRDPPTNQSA